MCIQYSNRFLDIHNSMIGYPNLDFSNYGYPKILLNIGVPKIDLWISINRILDIKKSIFGYNQGGKGISKKRIMDIQKSIFVYP